MVEYIRRYLSDTEVVSVGPAFTIPSISDTALISYIRRYLGDPL